MHSSVVGSILIMVLLVAAILVLVVDLENIYMDVAGAAMLCGCTWVAVGMLRGWRRQKREMHFLTQAMRQVLGGDPQMLRRKD